MSIVSDDIREAHERVQDAICILLAGLKYHEHDGHDIPKRIVRDALETLGIPLEFQP